MSTELKQAQDEARANALATNAGRKPKFGDLMRNPWASEGNPTRDGYFVRARVVKGRCNPGTWYEMTDGNGKFWEVSAEYQFFIEPAAAVPEGALPPLPKTWQERYFDERQGAGSQQMMMDYMGAEISEWRARAAVEADRARALQSDLSDAVLNAMYACFHRGDSVERVHKAVMALVSADRAQQGEPVAKEAQCLHCGKGVTDIDNCEDARFCNIAMVAPVSSTPTPRAVEKAADMLLAAAQSVVNDALEDAEDRVHICDRHDDDRKARAMPAPLQGLYYAVRAVRNTAPSHPSEAKAGEPGNG